MKTNDLRKLIETLLLSVCSNVYYQRAKEDALYPHIVFDLPNVTIVDARNDLYLDIDIWDKSKSAFNVNDLADAVEALLHGENLPQDSILPTFYVEHRRNLEDPQANIKHVLITALVQNYER